MKKTVELIKFSICLYKVHSIYFDILETPIDLLGQCYSILKIIFLSFKIKMIKRKDPRIKTFDFKIDLNSIGNTMTPMQYPIGYS